MKLRIETSQLNELSDAQKQKLRELWEPQVGDFITVTTEGIKIPYVLVDTKNKLNLIFTNSEIGTFGNLKDNCLPILSMGQMIEIVGCRELSKILEYGTIVDGVYIGLCDALWQAVKEIL